MPMCFKLSVCFHAINKAAVEDQGLQISIDCGPDDILQKHEKALNSKKPGKTSDICRDFLLISSFFFSIVHVKSILNSPFPTRTVS